MVRRDDQDSLGALGNGYEHYVHYPNTADKQEVIPFLQQDREQFLEYDLTRLVYTLTDPKKPVLGHFRSI